MSSAQRSALALALALAGCSLEAPVQIAPCGGRMVTGTDAIYVACPLLARLDLDGTVRWGVGEVVAGPVVPPAGDELYWAGVADGRSGVHAQAKASGATRPLATPLSVAARIDSVAVAGDRVFWIESDGPPTTWTLRQVPRVGGTATTVLSSTTALASLGGDAAALYWLAGGATVADGLDVTRLDLATGVVTRLAHLDAIADRLASLAEPGGVVVAVYQPDATIDAYRVRIGAPQPLLLGEDIRGTLAAADDRLMLGALRFDGAAATRILPAQPHSVDWVGLVGDDVYFTDGFALWRRPYAGEPSPQVPRFGLGPPLVGRPP